MERTTEPTSRELGLSSSRPVMRTLVLLSQTFDLLAVGFSLCISNQALFPGFYEFFAPAIVEILADAFASTKLSDGVIAS